MKVVLLVAIVLIFSRCGPSIRVFYEYDKSTDLSGFNNYCWAPVQAIDAKELNPFYYNELTDKRIKQAVDKQLCSRGFRVSDSGRVLEVHYHITIEPKVIAFTEPFNSLSGTPWPGQEIQGYPYKQGTLIVDLVEREENVLVWRGWATGAIEDRVSKKPAEAINKAVAKIFEKFGSSRSKRQ